MNTFSRSIPRIRFSVRQCRCMSTEEEGAQLLKRLRSITLEAQSILTETIERDRKNLNIRRSTNNSESALEINNKPKEKPTLKHQDRFREQLENSRSHRNQQSKDVGPSTSSRFSYDSKTKKTVDKLKTPYYTVPGGVDLKPGKLTKFLRETEEQQIQTDEFNNAITKYPISIILSSNSETIGVQFKKMVDELEQINYGENWPRDPNDVELLVDHHISGRIRLLRSFLKSNNSGVDDGEIAPKTDFLIACLSRHHITSSLQFFDVFNKRLKTHFNIHCAVLNVPTCPVLGLVKNPANRLNEQENHYLEKTFINIAKLGLTKVHKMEDGTLILTHPPQVKHKFNLEL
ncbi:unnamed protein product [Ambrosiozyma monospora]|uniref:Unnamed protein product n=1 Tax=Ambrosiozyma monospora TaxID=43982 RepID=A0A9W6Z2Z6_AMBMO|nr:unnamed protein product [Ambrosiozyma monospora]